MKDDTVCICNPGGSSNFDKQESNLEKSDLETLTRTIDTYVKEYKRKKEILNQEEKRNYLCKIIKNLVDLKPHINLLNSDEQTRYNTYLDRFREELEYLD